MSTVFSGGTYVNTTYTGATIADILMNTKTQLVTAGWTNLALSAGLGPGNGGVATVTIASPGVVNFPGHGWLGGEKVVWFTTGALPTGLVVATVYFVKYVDANNFNLAATLGGANINTTGSQSGVHTICSQWMLLKSATQANVTNPIVIRIKNNLATCAQFTIENLAGTVTGDHSNSAFGGSLLPAAAQTIRIIATKYHFLSFYPGAASAGRQFVMAGMMYVPTLVASVTDAGYMLSNTQSDGNVTNCNSLRSIMTLNLSGTANSQIIWNANLCENANTNSAGIGQPEVIVMFPDTTGTRGYRWANDDINTSDVLLTAGLTATTDEGKIKGQFYDMVYIADAFAVDSTDTFNAHNWFNITSNNTGYPRGGVWIAVS